MNTNRKTRPQPSLASLTTDEYHQLAEMVCTRTYESVRQQVNKPRSEGGFDLNISIKPLQVLHARVQRLNKINEKLAAGQKLTLTAYDEIHAGEKRAPEEIHDAIMSAAWILVTEHDNTPHQLLALQRLADFPARAELREQTAQIRAQSAQDLSRLRHQSLAHRTERMQFARARELRAQAKEIRAQELHTLKIQLAHLRLTLKFNNHGGTSSTSPILDSRDAIQTTSAIPADMKSPDAQSFSHPKSDIRNQTSEINSPSVFSVPPSSVPSVSLPSSPKSPIERLLSGELKSTVIPPEIPCPDPNPLIRELYPEYFQNAQQTENKEPGVVHHDGPAHAFGLPLRES